MYESCMRTYDVPYFMRRRSGSILIIESSKNKYGISMELNMLLYSVYIKFYFDKYCNCNFKARFLAFEKRYFEKELFNYS